MGRAFLESEQPDFEAAIVRFSATLKCLPPSPLWLAENAKTKLYQAKCYMQLLSTKKDKASTSSNTAPTENDIDKSTQEKGATLKEAKALFEEAGQLPIDKQERDVILQYWKECCKMLGETEINVDNFPKSIGLRVPQETTDRRWGCCLM